LNLSDSWKIWINYLTIESIFIDDFTIFFVNARCVTKKGKVVETRPTKASHEEKQKSPHALGFVSHSVRYVERTWNQRYTFLYKFVNVFCRR